jgi:hypothetical protein
MTKKIAIAATAILAAAVLAGCGRPAYGGEPAGGPVPLVPFGAILTGRAAMTSQTTASFIGHGIATSVGPVTNTGSIVFTGSDPSCPNSVTNVNTETLTNIAGDTLTIVSVDVACPTGPGTFHGTGQWHVDHGTGRFAGVTGTGTADGGADFIAGTFTMNLVGTITM